MLMNAINTIIEKAQQGDAAAFEQLLEAQYDTVFKFAFKWSGRREDAEDITQQACMKLAKGIQQFRFESNFTTWLYRLVINCAKDWQRSQIRHAHHGDEALATLASTPSNDHDIYLQQLLTQLDQASEGFKETLLLVHAEGLSHKEAADILDVKESTISWRIHEIRKYLQKQQAEEQI